MSEDPIPKRVPPQTVLLITRAQDGDRAALDELLRRYAPRVLDVVRVRLGRPLRRLVESADILQETLLEAFRSFDRFEVREDAHFLGWLARIAERRIQRGAEYHRAAKRDPGRLESLQRQGQSGSFAWEPAAGQTAAGTWLAREEERDGLLDALSELAPRYREVIVTREFLGASWEEVARQTEHSTANAARMTYHRARVALGQALRERGIGTQDH
jgi:RNA polymerase sigma-70 factor, ECF subfamily